jgi:hypothetical protein
VADYRHTPKTTLVPIRRRWWEFWQPLWREEWRTYAPAEIETSEGRQSVIRGKGRHRVYHGADVAGLLMESCAATMAAKVQKP